MRISDWSSDVCSSDLRHVGLRRARAGRKRPLDQGVAGGIGGGFGLRHLLAAGQQRARGDRGDGCGFHGVQAYSSGRCGCKSPCREGLAAEAAPATAAAAPDGKLAAMAPSPAAAHHRATMFTTVAHYTDPIEAHLARGRLLSEGIRSEEHTSELQSLMRISYAVFCLKK